MSTAVGERIVLAPAAPLAIVDIAMRTPAAPTAAAFWATELGYSAAESSRAGARDAFSTVVENWGTGQVGLVACGPDAAGLAERISLVGPDRFSETWLGGDAASDASVALRWLIDGFAGRRFERAMLGAISPSDDGTTRETWLVLAPLAEARAVGLRVLAVWGEEPAAGGIQLVASALGGKAEIEGALAAALPAEPARLPVRALWRPRDVGGSEAHAIITVCAAAALAVAYRALPASHGVGEWLGPRERGFGQFPRPRPWLREPSDVPRTALALLPGERSAVALSFSDADPEGADPRSLA
ncbi:MAG TPA: hypothetical protein VKU84_16270, partial [Stellaceae bacterium]|nr:hypothetical protein [Stellaceae bacterium]